MLNLNQDVVVVGGGVIGCSIAYYLAKAGIKTTLLERGRVGAQGTAAAVGVLSPTAGDEPSARLGRESLALYQDLANELFETCGIDIELVRCGQLDLALTDKEAGEVEGRCYQARDRGGDTVWLDRDRLLEMEPEITPSVVGAMFTRDVSRVNTQRLVEALRRSAIWHGADIRQDSEVVGLVRSGPRVGGVRLPEEEVYADHIVLAAGPWSRVIAEWIGVDLPVRPVRGQAAGVKPTERGVWTIVRGSGGLLVPRSDGTVAVGATVEEADFDCRVTAGGVSEILAAAGTLVPSLRNASLQWTASGLRPGTPDDMPVLGPIPGWSGIHLATGHFRSGVLLGPITGKFVADTVAGSEPDLMSEFSLARLRGAQVPV